MRKSFSLTILKNYSLTIILWLNSALKKNYCSIVYEHCSKNKNKFKCFVWTHWRVKCIFVSNHCSIINYTFLFKEMIWSNIRHQYNEWRTVSTPFVNEVFNNRTCVLLSEYSHGKRNRCAGFKFWQCYFSFARLSLEKQRSSTSYGLNSKTDWTHFS